MISPLLLRLSRQPCSRLPPRLWPSRQTLSSPSSIIWVRLQASTCWSVLFINSPTQRRNYSQQTVWQRESMMKPWPHLTAACKRTQYKRSFALEVPLGLVHKLRFRAALGSLEKAGKPLILGALWNCAVSHASKRPGHTIMPPTAPFKATETGASERVRYAP